MRTADVAFSPGGAAAAAARTSAERTPEEPYLPRQDDKADLVIVAKKLDNGLSFSFQAYDP